MGGEACIRKTRIPVWLLISYRRQNATDAHILEGHPDICAADLVNAFSYAEAYPDEIEKQFKKMRKIEKLQVSIKINKRLLVLCE